MAKKLNRNLVGLLTLVGMLLLAVTGFTLLANLPGQDPKVYEADAKKLEEEGKFDMAAQTYARAYSRDPAKNPEYLIMAARCALEDGKIGGAREFIRIALVGNPKLKSALEVVTELEYEIAQTYPTPSQWNRLLEQARKLVEVDDQSALAYQAMGTAYLALQGEDADYEAEGEKALKKALELDPTNSKVVDALVSHLFAAAERARLAGREDNADSLTAEWHSVLTTAIAKSAGGPPERAGDLKRTQAFFDIATGNVDQGLNSLEALANSDVTKVDSHLLLSRLYSGQFSDRVKTDMEKAKKLLEEAVRIEPERGEVYLELGGVYKSQREKEQDAARKREFRNAEMALYTQGLENVPKSTDFRMLKNNMARLNFYRELVLQSLSDAEQTTEEKEKNAHIESASNWISKLKEEYDPEAVEVRFLTVSLLNAQGRYVEATKEAELAERVAGVRPNLGIQVLLGELYARQRQWGAAEIAIRKAMALSPESSGLMLRLAQVYLTQNKAAEALDLLKSDDPGPRGEFLKTNPFAVRLRREAYQQLGQIDRAIEESSRLQGDASGDELRRAQLLIENHKTAEAEALLKKLFDAKPDDIAVVKTLVRLFQDGNRKEDAKTLVRTAISKTPENRVLKLLELELGDDIDEETRTQRVLELLNQEKDPFVRALTLYEYFASRDKNDEAKKYLDEAEAIQPDHPTIVDRQFRYALTKKDWDAAEKYAKKNASLNIDGTDGAMAQGRLAMAKGDFDHAIELMRAGLQRYPSFSLGWTYLAEAYMSANRPADARSVLQEALKLDPTNGYANRGLAEIFLKEGNMEEAERALQRASQVLPGDTWVQRQLQILREKDNPREGIATREALRKDNPKDLQNLVLLARLYALPEVAEFDKASEVFRAALEVSGNDNALGLEYALFLGREDVNRPSEGDALLTGLLSKEQDQSKKALLATYLGRFYEAQKVLATADRHYRLAVSLDPSSPILVSAGEYYSRTNRYHDALEYFDRALKQLSPDSAEAEDIFARTIALTLAIGDLERSRQGIDAFVKKYPKNPQGLIYEGAYHRIAGDVQKARASFDSHLEKNPDSAVALWQRGQLFMLLGKWQKAIEDLSKAKTFSPDAFNYQHRISLAECLMEAGQHESAIAELRSILDKNPEDQPVAEALIDIYSRIGPSRYGEAENLIFTYLRKYPRDYKWPMLLGRLAERSLNMDKAVDAYEKASELSRYRRNAVEALFRVCKSANRPQVIISYASEKLSARLLSGMPSALASVAWAYSKTGQEPQALEAYDQALTASGRDFAVYTQVIAEMVQVFGLEEALARAKQRVESDPDNIDRQKVLVHLLHLSDKVDDALVVTDRILKNAVREDDTLFGQLAQGMLLERKQQYADAAPRYETALKIDPSNSLALNNLAYLLGEHLNKPAEALPYAQKAKQNDPANPDVLDTLGWTLALNNRHGEALGVLLHGLEIKRDHAVILYHLGLLHLRRGELEEAKERLEAAKKAATTQGIQEYLSKINEALESLERGR